MNDDFDLFVWKLKSMQLFLNYLVILFCTLFALTTGTDSNFEICESKNASIYSASINIRDTKLQTTNEQTSCQCSVSSGATLNIVLKIFVLIHNDANEQFPLEIKYEKDRQTHTVNTLKSLQPFLQMDAGDMIVAENASDVIVRLEKQSNATVNVKFVIHIKTSDETEVQINVNCHSSAKSKDTNIKQDKADDNEVFEYIEDLCSSSPQLVIMLAGVCVALLIIILIVSIILCCVVPRKQQEQIRKIRHSMIPDTGDIKNADRIRPEPRLSKNAQTANADDNKSNVSDVPFPEDYFSNAYQYRQSILYQSV